MTTSELILSLTTHCLCKYAKRTALFNIRTHIAFMYIGVLLILHFDGNFSEQLIGLFWQIEQVHMDHTC